MSIIPNFAPYNLYVWTAYGVVTVAIIGLFLVTFIKRSKAQRLLKRYKSLKESRNIKGSSGPSFKPSPSTISKRYS